MCRAMPVIDARKLKNSSKETLKNSSKEVVTQRKHVSYELGRGRNKKGWHRSTAEPMHEAEQRWIIMIKRILPMIEIWWRRSRSRYSLQLAYCASVLGVHNNLANLNHFPLNRSWIHNKNTNGGEKKNYSGNTLPINQFINIFVLDINIFMNSKLYDLHELVKFLKFCVPNFCLLYYLVIIFIVDRLIIITYNNIVIHSKFSCPWTNNNWNLVYNLFGDMCMILKMVIW